MRLYAHALRALAMAPRPPHLVSKLATTDHRLAIDVLSCLAKVHEMRNALQLCLELPASLKWIETGCFLITSPNSSLPSNSPSLEL